MRTAILGLGLAFLAGCSGEAAKKDGGATASASQEFDEVLLLLREAGGGGKLPAKVDDLAKFSNLYPNGFAKVKSGDIVVVWGVSLAGEGSMNGTRVVAYEKKAPTEGGRVLLESGKVETMSASAVSAALPKK